MKRGVSSQLQNEWEVERAVKMGASNIEGSKAMRETEELEVGHSQALGLVGQVKEFGTYPRSLKNSPGPGSPGVT